MAEGFYIMNSRQKWLLTLALTCTLPGALPGRAQENGPPEPSASGWRKFGETRTLSELPQPAELTAVAGTWVTMRVDQPLSSDHNQPGDAFTGTLTQPLVVNGVVIARRGQTVGGRVAEAQSLHGLSFGPHHPDFIFEPFAKTENRQPGTRLPSPFDNRHSLCRAPYRARG